MTTPAATEPVGTSRRHTSEPRWSMERPAIDRPARTILIVADGDVRAAQSALAWTIAGEAAGLEITRIAPEQAAVAAALEAATATTRLMVAGDECTLAMATAAAERAGWSRAEVRTQLTTADGPRPVRCVHCTHITAAAAAVDEVTDCGGCGVSLLIFPHYSRRLGAYLGFRADAEELPA